MSSSASPAVPPASHNDALQSIPAPVIRFLVISAPILSAVKRIALVIRWRSNSQTESLALVAVWWGICLGGKAFIKYLFPLTILLCIIPQLSTTKPNPIQSSSSQEDVTLKKVLQSISQFSTLNQLLPPSPTAHVVNSFPKSKIKIVRLGVACWMGWLAAVIFLGLPTVLGVVGTYLLFLPSPYLQPVIHIFQSSKTLSHVATFIKLIVLGPEDDTSPSTELKGWVKYLWNESYPRGRSRRKSLVGAGNSNATMTAIDDKKVEETPLMFRFEILENQRWWMGLDWTGALLPNERPSWCDVHLSPISPPTSFSLPPSSTIVVPIENGSTSNGRERRVAWWEWIEHDWSVVITHTSGAVGSATNPLSAAAAAAAGGGAGAAGTSANASAAHRRDSSVTVPRSTPAGDLQPNSPASGTSTAGTFSHMAESTLAKGLERFKNVTANGMTGMTLPSFPTSSSPTKSQNISSSQPTASSNNAEHEAASSATSITNPAPSTPTTNQPQATETPMQKEDLNTPTDNEGWSYGDNKWESMGAKGGLGKFTRRRRWIRRAVLRETVEFLDDNSKEGEATALTFETNVMPQTTKTAAADVGQESEGLGVIAQAAPGGVIIQPHDEKALSTANSALRMRLKKVVEGQ